MVLKEVYLFPVSGKEVNGFVKGGVEKKDFSKK